MLRPGMHDGNRTSLEAMRELTGFRLAQVTPSKAWASPTSVGRQLGLQSGFGLDGPHAVVRRRRCHTGRNARDLC